MTLQTLLGSAVIAALVAMLGGVLTKMLIDTRIEAMKSELNRELEVVKSELDVWATFRNETIKEMWKAHREIVASMTQVILAIQVSIPAAPGDAEDVIVRYRRLIHQHIDLLTPEDVDLCQQFLDGARRISTGDVPADDANALKAIRRSFYEQMAQVFRLQEVMPWISGRSR